MTFELASFFIKKIAQHCSVVPYKNWNSYRFEKKIQIMFTFMISIISLSKIFFCNVAPRKFSVTIISLTMSCVCFCSTLLCSSFILRTSEVSVMEALSFTFMSLTEQLLQQSVWHSQTPHAQLNTTIQKL